MNKTILLKSAVPLFLAVFFFACGDKSPQLEKLALDTSELLTQYNVYGQPHAVFSKNGFPIIEYGWLRAHISGVNTYFYVKNSKYAGQAEISITLTETMKQLFEVKPDTAYVIRVINNVSGSTLPWNATQWTEHQVTLQTGSLKDTIKFQVPQIFNIDDDRAGLRVFRIMMNELPAEGAVDPANLPDKAFLDDRECSIGLRYCLSKEGYVLLRSDGLVGRADYPPLSEVRDLSGHYRVDGDDRWEVKDGFLTIIWNNGFATNTFKLTNRDAEYLFGTHSNHPFPLWLNLMKKSQD